MQEIQPEIPAHFARRNDRGLYELVCLHTGKILCVQTTPRDLLEAKFDRLTKIDTPQGPVWIEKGINFDIIKHLESVPYSKLLGDLICEYIVEGKSLKNAIEALNLKYSTVVRWRREHKDFADELKQAEKDRGMALHDEVLEVARDEKTANKTRIAAVQWAAEKADPEKYGSKTKISGDKDNPVSFVISTGISREQQAPTLEAEARPVDANPAEPPDEEIEIPMIGAE